MDFPFKLLTTSRRFISPNELFTKACGTKLVWFGEFHSEERITIFLEQLIRNITTSSTSESSSSSSNSKMHIVWEHFSLEMNDLLKEYQQQQKQQCTNNNKQQHLTLFDQLVEDYKKIGTEGHDLKPYRKILEYCQEQGSNRIQLHGGFIPRPYASAFMKAATEEEKLSLYQTLSSEEKKYVPNLETLEAITNNLLLEKNHDTNNSSPAKTNNFELYGSSEHYNVFESLLSGREIYSSDCPPPDDARRGIFQAQLLKDWAMAHYVQQLVNSCPSTDRFLIVAGKGHVSHGCGVPEIYSWLQAQQQQQQQQNDATKEEKDDEDELLICAQMMYELDELDDRQDRENDEMLERCILESDVVRGSMMFDGTGSSLLKRPVADVLYIYDEQDWSSDDDDDDSNSGDDGDEETAARQETMEAYNQVGATATTPGNASKARAILTYLGYTAHEQELIGRDDIYNYQGVGNPFPLAKVQTGDHVIDLGSGLGVDSFVAANYCTDTGRVVGVDIAQQEVKHANRRAKERGIASFVSFQQNDIERLLDDGRKNKDSLVESNSFDVAISNGAFCLIPNKTKAFEQVYRILRPGGRMAICTTTVRKDLTVETQWPLCMRMFVHLDQLKPICEDIGFINITIDLSDSELEFELEEDENDSNDDEEENNSNKNNNNERKKIHVGGEEFRHLQDYNMNELCARVVVYGEKPKDL